MTMQSNSQQQLRHICERLVRLENERAELGDEVKDIKKQAKDDGFDPALINKTVRLLRMEREKRKKEIEQMDLLDTYIHAVGILDEPDSDNELADDGSEE